MPDNCNSRWVFRTNARFTRFTSVENHVSLVPATSCILPDWPPWKEKDLCLSYSGHYYILYYSGGGQTRNPKALLLLLLLFPKPRLEEIFGHARKEGAEREKPDLSERQIQDIIAILWRRACCCSCFTERKE